MDITNNGVYCLTFPNNKRYVGISVHSSKYKKGIPHRWKAYQNYRCKDQTKLYNALTKYGVDNVKFEVILRTDDREEAKQLEIDLIYLWNLQDDNFGYNITEGGDRVSHCLGKKFTEEQKAERVRKMKERGTLESKLKGTKLSEETKQKLSISIKEALKKVDMVEANKKRVYGEHSRDKQKEYARSCKGSNSPRYRLYHIKNIVTGETFSGGKTEILNTLHVGVFNIVTYGHSKNWYLDFDVKDINKDN